MPPPAVSIEFLTQEERCANGTEKNEMLRFAALSVLLRLAYAEFSESSAAARSRYLWKFAESTTNNTYGWGTEEAYLIARS